MLRKWMVLVVSAVQLTGCCGAREQLAVSAGSVHTLTFAWPDRSVVLQLGGRLDDRELPEAQFRGVYDALRGRTGNTQAVVLTIGERDPVSDEFYALTLALPAALQRGARYVVSGTLPLSDDGAERAPMWGTRELRDVNQAEVGLSMSTYSFPPAQHTLTFVATHATGTVEITERGTGWFGARLSLRLTDAEGRTVDISGNVQAQAERYTPPCT